MTGMRRILPHVLLMPAIQFRHPIAVFIHMKANDLAQHPGRWGFQGLHTFILRAFERASLVNSGSSFSLERLRHTGGAFDGPRGSSIQRPLLMLHSLMQIQNKAGTKETKTWRQATKRRRP